jgi:organic hydroperoxide reductase OsmC/OhrA
MQEFNLHRANLVFLFTSILEGLQKLSKMSLKITKIRVKYHLKVPKGKTGEAKEALSSYLTSCPAAQSVIGCIDLQHDMAIEEMTEE